MGLFDLFKPKTVEGRYKTLLKLFRRVHRTFTITKNEKCIIEFTYGIDNENKQYWSIEQPFDRESVCINGISFYDPSKKVTISMHTTVDGYPVKTDKTFDQSVNQIVMFNTIMQSSIEEIAKVVDSLYGNTIRKGIQEENKNKINNTLNVSSEQSFLSLKEKDIQSFLTQKMKEKGLTVNEAKVKEEYEKLCDEVYDGSKDCEIDLLTTNQKYALLILAVSLCFNITNSSALTYSQRSSLEYFASTLKLNIVFLNNIIDQKHYLNTPMAIKEVKTIHMDGPLINFVFACIDIVNESDDKDKATTVYIKLLRNMRFSQDDIDATLHNRYNFRFENYKEDSEEEKQESEGQIIQTWSLLDFVRKFGKPRLATCKEHTTNKEFKCVTFGEKPNMTFVSFSSEIGELTSREISERKNQLKVVKQVKEGKENYILYE